MERNAPGTPRPSFRRPTILAGSGSTLLGRPLISLEQSARAGFHALDLDLRDAWHNDVLGSVGEMPPARLRSVWIPRQYTGLWRDARAERLRLLLATGVEHHGLRTVIVPTSDGTRQRGTSLGQLARQMSTVGGLRLAMRVSAENLLAQPGSHLDHVANLRRMAEEWDLDLALDLTGRDIASWEAEATLMRLFPRLTLVRIRPLYGPDGGRSMEAAASVMLRTVTMLADQAYSGIISIAPPHAPVSRVLPIGSTSLAPVVATRDDILAAYGRLDAYDLSARQKKQQFG